MSTKLVVVLEHKEREALYRAAQADMRPLRDQARWLIRKELERRRLLPASDTQQESQGDGQTRTDPD